MLIFPNGTAILYSFNTEECIDTDGNPIAVEQEEGKRCLCTINVLSEDKRGKYSDGQFNNCAYSVSFNMDDVGDKFYPQSVKLVHDYKGDIGSFIVQRVEYYPITRTIEIWV